MVSEKGFRKHPKNQNEEKAGRISLGEYLGVEQHCRLKSWDDFPGVRGEGKNIQKTSKTETLSSRRRAKV